MGLRECYELYYVKPDIPYTYLLNERMTVTDIVPMALLLPTHHILKTRTVAHGFALSTS